MTLDPAQLAYDAAGLIPVVVQDAACGAVLMLAYADRRAVETTLATGEAHFWSRSRRRPWRKGETSGNVLEVVEVAADCDGDALLLKARPAGPACHRGTRSCFDPPVAPAGGQGGAREHPGVEPGALELGWLWRVLGERRSADAEASYTAGLLAAGPARVAQKVGEEAVETVIAALDREGGKGALVAESADLLYHLLVLWLARGVEPGAVAAELAARHAAASGEGDESVREAGDAGQGGSAESAGGAERGGRA